MRIKGSTPTQYAVFKEINMQLVQIGSDFGADNTNDESAQYNNVAHWGNDLYAVGKNEIWKYDVAANGPWTSFHSYVSQTAFAQKETVKMGFCAASINGSGVLVMAYPGPAAQDMTFVSIDRDGNATESSAQSILGTDWNIGSTPIISPLAWRNNVAYRVGRGNATHMVVYDVSAETVINVSSLGDESMQHSQLCISNDTLYSVECIQGSSPILVKVVGSASTSLGTLTGSISAPIADYPYWGSALCEVDDKLFAFIPDDGATGFQCIQANLDSNGDVTSFADVSSVVLPTSLSSFSTGTETHALIRIDNTTNSGILPIYEMVVYENHTEGTSPTLYRWDNAPSGRMFLVDGGLDNYQFCKISATDGTAGERVWSGSGVINASAPLLTINGANIDAEFTIYGASQTGISLELIYDKEGETTSAIGTLSSTTVGSIVSNQVVGLTADGITKVKVGWSAAADGIISGDNPKVAARIFFP